jgi:hypothetical protein
MMMGSKKNSEARLFAAVSFLFSKKLEGMMRASCAHDARLMFL